MTTYKEIFGKPVKVVSSDPANETEGQIWYNTTSGTFKTTVTSEAWSTGAAAITARWGAMSFGSQTAGVMAGGLTATARVVNTEEYNGSGFSAGGDIGTARYRGGGAGTETAGLIFGGESPGGDTGDTEEYNGSSWSEQNNLSKARRTTGLGIQTAAFAIGGYDNTNKQSQVESYNGTSWTSGTALPLSGLTEGGSGTTSSGRTAGGFFGPGSTHPPSGGGGTTNNNLGWNGSSWSDDTVLPSNRYNTSGFGNSGDDYYAAGGRASPPNASINTVNYWNGTSWAVSPTLATARYNGQGQNGTPTAFVYMSGNASGTVTTATEEFNKTATVITQAVFSSGATANTARRQLGYTTSGTQNSCMGYGGFSPGGFINNSETYDGTSWSEGNNLNDSKGQLAGAGTATAALAFGGNSNNANTEEYDGTSWSEQNNMNAGRYELGGCGLQTAGLACGGDTSPPGTSTMVNTEEYDGTNWTTGGNLNTARRENDAAGSQTAAIVAGGGTPSGTTATESYNGTAWTTVNSKIRATVAPRTMGGLTSQTAAVTNGGHDGSAGIVGTEQWNGTNFITGVNMAQQRFSQASDGSISAGIVFMGDSPTPAMLKTSEEYNGETVAANYKTLSSS